MSRAAKAPARRCRLWHTCFTGWMIDCSTRQYLLVVLVVVPGGGS